MKPEWAEMELGDFVELKRGYDLPKKNRADGNVPIISSSGESGFHDEPKVKGPGVVTGRYGTIGEVFYTENDFWPLNTTLYVKDFRNNDPLFVYFLLKTLRFSDYSDKAAVPGINRNHLHKAKIYVPTNPGYQRNLAEKLWAFDRKTVVNTQLNQTLEQIAQTIFKCWFVDFEPTRAKIAARERWRAANECVGTSSPTCYADQFDTPRPASTLEQAMTRAAMAAISGKSEAELDQLSPDQQQQLKAIADLFPDALVESVWGEIPEGWCYRKAIEVADVAIGKTPPRKEPLWFSGNSSGVPWVSIKDLGTSGAFIKATSEYLTEEAVNKFKIRRIPDKTVLLSFKLTIGRVSISDGEVVSNEAIAHFRLTEKSAISSEYLYLYLKNFDYAALGSTSSIATAVNSKTIKNMPIMLPSVDILRSFESVMRPIFLLIRNQLSEIRSLSFMRDSLLPELMSGNLPSRKEEI
ncbi:restriction endonuclease subunit S [Proteobacteria bacterium 005FR1]|nr:restriction endonuclease subunit S [Proteobacteria bacterium 005FR1]